MRWAGHVARMGEEGGVYRVLVGKPEGKRPLGRPRRRWVGSKVLWGIFGFKQQEISCRKLHNEDIHNLCFFLRVLLG